MLKTVLVTGGAGFIGSHLVDALIEKKYQVLIVDNLSTGKKSNLNPKAKFYKLDIVNPKLGEIFKREKPDYVFHLAAQINVRKSIAGPAADAKTNVLGSLNLLENCKKYKVKKIIFSSSGGAIYGDPKIIPTPETTIPHPQSPYAIAKFTIEQYLDFYYKVYGLNYTILRYANVYGPRQDAHGEAGVVAIFNEKIRQNQLITINGDGRQTRDFVCVTDVVEANMLAIGRGSCEPYNIGTGHETSINELSKILINQAIKNGIKYTGEIIHATVVKGEPRRSCLNCQKAKQELGWQPINVVKIHANNIWII